MSHDVFVDFFKSLKRGRRASGELEGARDQETRSKRCKKAPARAAKAPPSVEADRTPIADSSDDSEAEVLEFGEDNHLDPNLRNEVLEFIQAKSRRGASPSEPLESDSRNEVRSVFVGNLPCTLSQMDIRNYFEKAVGKTSACRMLARDRERSVVAFVDFETHKMAEKAVRKCNGRSCHGRTICVRLARAKTPDRPSSRSVYVRNLSFDATEEDVRRLFEPCGELVKVRLPVFPDSGKRRGYAFVEFRTEESVLSALKLDRTEMLGRQVLVEVAKV